MGNALNKKKWIGEMARDLATSIVWDEDELPTVCCLETATRLYIKGWVKQIEGEWVYKFTLDGDRFYECSVCGRQEVVNCLCKERNLAEDLPYCHCGAKMKGEEQ